MLLYRRNKKCVTTSRFTILCFEEINMKFQTDCFETVANRDGLNFIFHVGVWCIGSRNPRPICAVASDTLFQFNAKTGLVA